MKAHNHRLLNALPDLCRSPLVKQVCATFGGHWTGPILDLTIDSYSVFVRTEDREAGETWEVFDKDSITTIEVTMSRADCEAAGVRPRVEAILEHIAKEKKKEGRA